VAGRITRLSVTFKRSVLELGFRPGTPSYRAVFATVAALADAVDLPGIADDETTFAPGRAFVRRVVGHNAWILYRFDSVHVFVLTARGQPPVPAD